ncbi:MAG TPA: MerR family transcriptional regulator [Candidatus Nanopelagicaceae bacterium]|nr:MerR family transcriptional regulator [Candidatus Nanopelagicaceae bacterium]
MLSADQAAIRLNSTARIVRYREKLGLLGPMREPRRHRRFTEADLAALRLAEAIERNYGVSPSELAFALRALTTPALAGRIQALAEMTSRLVASGAVLNFEQQKALALLSDAKSSNPAGPGPNRGTVEMESVLPKLQKA